MLSSILAFLAPLAFMPAKPKEAKPAPAANTLDAVIAWLETKDPRETYDWSNQTSPCMWTQYGKESGIGHYTAVCDAFGQKGSSGAMCIEPFNIALRTPHTFGAALQRARRYRKYHALA